LNLLLTYQNKPSYLIENQAIMDGQ